MARTKQTARKSLKLTPANESQSTTELPVVERCTLLQLMGLPKEGIGFAKTANANWKGVVERLSTYPHEAAMKESFHNQTTPFDVIDYKNEVEISELWSFEKYPLTIALANEATPLTKEALDAFISAYPDIVTAPRSPLAFAVSKNATLCENMPDIMDIFQRSNPHCCGLQRTRTFQLMGFSTAIDGPTPQFNNYRGDGHIVDWQAVEHHLNEHPEEAKIVCSGVFPLEVALQFQRCPPPLSTVQLLLKHCPEAATIDDSCALMWACSLHLLEDPEVVRAVLRANPKMASVNGQSTVECYIEEQFGLPLHTAVFFLPCAAQVIPDLMEAYPAAIADTSSIYDQIPLQVAVRDRRRASVDLIKVLLEYGHRYKVGEECGRGQLFAISGNNDDSGDCWALNNLIDNACMYREDGPERAEETFQNVCLGFQAAGAFKTQLTVDDMWEYPLLQGALEFGKMEWIARQILDRHMTEADLRRTDGLGRTPLAVAIAMAGSNDNHDPDFINFSVIIERLLDEEQNGSPETASLPITVNGISMLPLHLALQQGVGLDDGSKHIVNAFPGALSIPDTQSKLIPCLLAAVGERARVETIFGLMIMRPNLIATLCR